MSYSLTTDKSWSQTMGDIRECFRIWAKDAGARIDWDVEANVSTSQRSRITLSPEERAVHLAFMHPRTGREVSIRIDSQQRPVDNLRVCYLIAEDIRKNEKRGLGDMMAQAYLQIAAPERERDPYEVLGVRRDSPREVIEGAYRALAKKHHPDAGGDAETFKEIRNAWERINGDGK